MDRISIDFLDIKGYYSFAAGKGTKGLCTLCKQSLDGPTSSNLNEGLLKVMITNGKCGHSFHKVCIDSYHLNGNSSCPICMTPWNHSSYSTHHYTNK